MLNGYELAERLRKARRRYHLSAPTQALYYELVAICNEEEWADVFTCSNDDLFRALKISETSLNSYRQELIQSKLIFYKSGKSKKAYGQYSFVKEINGSKIHYQYNDQRLHQPNNHSAGESTHQPDDHSNEKRLDNIQTKTQTGNSNRKSTSGTSVPVKSDNDFFNKFTAVWFEVYEQAFDTKPTFGALEGGKMKALLKKFKAKAEEKQFDWTLEVAEGSFRKFLEVALSEKWYKENFQLQILDSKFDVIIQKAIGLNGSTQGIENVFNDWK